MDIRQQVSAGAPIGGFFSEDIFKLAEIFLFYGYIDESGTPGTKINDNDYLAICLVIVENHDKLEKINRAIEGFRDKQRLSPNYEFHFARNSPNTQREFIKLIAKLEFRFIFSAIKKTKVKNAASYLNLVNMLKLEISKKQLYGLNIEMDFNPTLYKILKTQFRGKNTILRIKQKRSSGHNLIQLTDYIAALNVRKLKRSIEMTPAIKRIFEKTI